MEKGNSKITTKQWMMLFFEALGWTAINVLGYLFSNYYSLVQDAFGYSAAEIANLNTLMSAASAVSYLFGGIVADRFKPKWNMTVAYAGMIVCCVAVLMRPAYIIMQGVAILVSVFGLGFYISSALKYVASMGTREQMAKIYGYFYMLSAIQGLIITPIVSGIISKNGSYGGLRAALLIYCVFMVVSLAIHFGYVEKNVTLQEGKVKTESEKFSFKTLFELLKNPNMYFVMLMGCATTITNHVVIYVQPLLKTEFGASESVINFVAQWANTGTALVLAPIAGIVAVKLGSTMRVITISIIFGVIAAGVMIVMPFGPAYIVPLVCVVFCLRGVFSIGKPARNSMVGESRLPKASRGTVIGAMFALTGIQKTAVAAGAGYCLTHYEGATGHRILYAAVTGVLIVCLFLAFVFSKRLQKAKERDAIEGAPEDLMI